MRDLATLLPARRPELRIRPLGDQGRYVVKDPPTGALFHLGEAEYFLLTRLDGERTAEAVCAAYAERSASRVPGRHDHREKSLMSA